MKIRNAFVSVASAAALVFLAASNAQAQDDKMQMRSADRGWYISGLVGAHQTNDSDIDGSGIASEAEFDWGLAGLAGVGYDYGRNWRAEIEAGYRGADIECLRRFG